MTSGNKQPQQLKDLIARGKAQGYLTYAEVNDHLPNDIVDPEQIEDIVNMINDMGIGYPMRPSLMTTTPPRKPKRHWSVSTPNSAEQPIRFECTCAKWARLNY